MIPFSVMLEEFEQGTWIADLVSTEEFTGTFEFAGVTWTGFKYSERLESERFYTRVVGGAGKLGTVLNDKYYSGNVFLQAAVQDVCRESGETFGSAQPGISLSTLERLRGPAYAALDSLATALGMMWWIDRDGKLQVKPARDVGSKVEGQRVSSDVDSVVIVQPDNLTIGALYGDEDSKPVRHIRWTQSPERFEACLYFLPFVFRAPAETRYSSLYSARVDRDNGDGTIDVIAGGRFGVTKVPLFCGVPGSKVKVNGGEEVTLGFFGGDPQKPFAVAMAQSTSASKSVARKDDTVKVSIPAGSFLISCSGSPAVGVLNPLAIDVTGTITSGSERLKVGD